MLGGQLGPLSVNTVLSLLLLDAFLGSSAVLWVTQEIQHPLPFKQVRVPCANGHTEHLPCLVALTHLLHNFGKVRNFSLEIV